MKDNKKDYKVETIEQFLARGGRITKIPYRGPNGEEHCRRMFMGPPTPLTWSDAEDIYGEPDEKDTHKKKKGKTKRLDLSKIPQYLKKELNIEDLEDK